MADIVAVKTEHNVETPDKAATILWETVTEANAGGAFNLIGKSDRSVQMTGDFGGGALSLLGSIDGVNYTILRDFDGDPITVTESEDGLVIGVRPTCPYIKPGGGTGTAMDVDVFVYASG